MPSVLVTGAARDVIAGVRTDQDAEAVTKAHPQRVSAVILDITDAGHIAKLAKSLPERLDAVINNAGIAVAGPVETVSPDSWREQLEVNVIGQFAVTQAVLPQLRKARGRVLFVSSVNGRIATPMLGPYSASKLLVSKWNSATASGFGDMLPPLRHCDVFCPPSR